MKIHDEQRRLHRRQWARVSVAACILLTFVCLGLWKFLDTRRVETLTACTKKWRCNILLCLWERK